MSCGLKSYRLQQAADQLLRRSHRESCFEPWFCDDANVREVTAWERVVLCLALAEYDWIPLRELKMALQTLQRDPASLPPELNITDPPPGV